MTKPQYYCEKCEVLIDADDVIVHEDSASAHNGIGCEQVADLSWIECPQCESSHHLIDRDDEPTNAVFKTEERTIG